MYSSENFFALEFMWGYAAGIRIVWVWGVMQQSWIKIPVSWQVQHLLMCHRDSGGVGTSLCCAGYSPKNFFGGLVSKGRQFGEEDDMTGFL